jgi:hypothetical protein
MSGDVFIAVAVSADASFIRCALTLAPAFTCRPSPAKLDLPSWTCQEQGEANDRL